MGASSTSDARVAVLYGGRSSEREVSLATGRAVLEALRDAEDGRGPAATVAVEIDADGRWSVDGAAPSGPDAAVRTARADAWFLGLHGGEGEDGSVQGLLAALGQAHTGSGTRGSALAMDKSAALALASRAGLSVPRGREVSRADLDRVLASGALAQLRGPAGWFVKPVSGGSSVGAGPARDEAELGVRLAAVFELDERALVEEAVDGLEASVGVLDPVGEGPRALPPVEIRPHDGRFFDYEEKYSESGALELCPPESFSPSQVAALEDAARRAHVALRAESYSRSDFLVRGDEVLFLELNTLPGFTARSLVPKEALAEGLDFRGLCLALVTDALARGVRR